MSRVVGKGESVLLRKPPNLRADLSSRFKRCLSICFPLRSGFGERAGRSPDARVAPLPATQKSEGHRLCGVAAGRDEGSFAIRADV